MTPNVNEAIWCTAENFYETCETPSARPSLRAGDQMEVRVSYAKALAEVVNHHHRLDSILDSHGWLMRALGSRLSTLSRIATWHIRDETCHSAEGGLGMRVTMPPQFAAHWGDGTTSSSDGLCGQGHEVNRKRVSRLQRFKSGGVAGKPLGQSNVRYGNEPGATFYTHISDQYAPPGTVLVPAMHLIGD